MAACLAGSALAASGVSRIAVEPESFDFGRVRAGTVVQKSFHVRNFGDGDLVIEEIVTDCDCTAALLDDEDQRLGPGERALLRVRLATRERGRTSKKVLLRSNDPDREVLEITITVSVQ